MSLKEANYKHWEWEYFNTLITPKVGGGGSFHVDNEHTLHDKQNLLFHGINSLTPTVAIRAQL